MPNIQHIETLDLPELQPYRTLRRPTDHIRAGIFVAEGEKVVRRLLHSPLRVVSILTTLHWFEQFISFHHFDNDNQVTIFIADKKLLETIVGFRLHQGVMAIGKVPECCSLHQVLGTLTKPYMFVALDGLVNAENVGVIVRNCAAFGVQAIIVGESSCSPYLRRAVRNSMGGIFQLAVIHTHNLVDTLTGLRTEYNIRIIGAHPHGEVPLTSINLEDDVCFVFGNEGAGISEEVLSVCSDYVAIPMMRGTDSLNVSSASAVFLYEACKQRTHISSL